MGALVFVVLVAWPGAAAAADRVCAAAPAVAATVDTDAALTAAQALVTPLDRPRARALYLAILAHDPEDEEARVGLAHVDAWDGCYALAERGYRDVLQRSPGNAAACGGLADILVWTGRWKEAQVAVDAGLARSPLSPELLARRARISAGRGDVSVAASYLDEAERVAPLDPEVREARDRLLTGQARIGQRVQIFPPGYDDVATTDVSVMQRVHRWRFELGATVVSRHGAERETRSGLVKTTVIDGRPSAGAYYHYDGGGWIGASLGVSEPALSLPRYAVAVTGFTPLGRRFSLSYSTAYWQYADDRDVVIVSPALGYALTDDIDLTARYWLTSVIVRGSANVDATVDYVHSLGGRVGWRPDARWSLGVDYTYGVQLERNPSATELLQLRSHILGVFARRLVSRAFGVDAAISVERRTSLGAAPIVLGPAAEVGIFTRW